ncbi:hypothetical protein BDN72DRAFT_866113, partial [Pluteus cervinus]
IEGIRGDYLILAHYDERYQWLKAVEQMKIVCQDSFSKIDLARWRPIVYKNALESAKAVVIYMRKRKVNIKCQEYSNQVLTEPIPEFPFKPPIPNTDSVISCFFNKARRVGADNYLSRLRSEYAISFAMGHYRKFGPTCQRDLRNG